ncbi:UDP-2,3-diacylglucosamine diphosphatase, partial [uncultured Duncaniella sp.]
MRDLTYFLSDLHLGAGYIPDHRAHERRVVDFLRSIEPRAKRIYLLGDILDYWWEYRDVVPRGFVRFFGELARLADSGVEITWFKGNHDIWIFDYLPSEIGLEVHDGIMV